MSLVRDATITGAVALTAIGGAPAIARGQEEIPSCCGIPAALATLAVGDEVRAFGGHGGAVEGRVKEPWPDRTLRLEVDDVPDRVIALPLPLVDSLEVKVDRADGGAFLGGGIGVGIGLLALHGIANLTCEAVDNECDSGPTTAAWVGFAVGGAALGAGIGWIVGRDNSRWERVYP